MGEENEKAKAKRYEPKEGKSAIACTIEMWGHIGVSLEAVLHEFTLLATMWQFSDGFDPTRWCQRWCIQISINVAMRLGKALYWALPNCERNDVNKNVQRSLIDTRGIHSDSGNSGRGEAIDLDDGRLLRKRAEGAILVHGGGSSWLKGAREHKKRHGETRACPASINH